MAQSKDILNRYLKAKEAFGAFFYPELTIASVAQRLAAVEYADATRAYADDLLTAYGEERGDLEAAMTSVRRFAHRDHELYLASTGRTTIPIQSLGSGLGQQMPMLAPAGTWHAVDDGLLPDRTVCGLALTSVTSGGVYALVRWPDRRFAQGSFGVDNCPECGRVVEP